MNIEFEGSKRDILLRTQSRFSFFLISFVRRAGLLESCSSNFLFERSRQLQLPQQ